MRVRKIAKSDYQIHVRPSFRMEKFVPSNVSVFLLSLPSTYSFFPYFLLFPFMLFLTFAVLFFPSCLSTCFHFSLVSIFYDTGSHPAYDNRRSSPSMQLNSTQALPCTVY